jgi:hypothetical protein
MSLSCALRSSQRDCCRELRSIQHAPATKAIRRRRRQACETAARARSIRAWRPPYDCLPLGIADFTNGLPQLETYLRSSSANRASPAFTTSAFMSAVCFCGMKTCGEAQVKSM